jgi:hypothetical protein
MVKISNFRSLQALILSCFLLVGGSASGGKPLDITTPPSKAEWQHFNKMNQAQLVKLWQFQVARGHKNLGAWAWQWRLGWIRQCLGDGAPKPCSDILDQALSDEAMVVRAEAATALGIIYRGRANERIVKNLAKSFTDPRNVRHGGPLFVCDRILAALRNIGGELADETAGRLANKHPSTAAYWTKMQRQTL